MRAWMAMGTVMLLGAGTLGADRVTPPVHAAGQAADQAAQVLAGMRDALGGARLERVTALSVEGPFRRQMGQRQVEGTLALVLQGPDRMHRTEDTELPGGAAIERTAAVSGGASWEDVRNRGGMGGGMQFMMRGPGGPEMNEDAREKMRTARLTAEMQRWMFALLAVPAGEVTYAGVAEAPDGRADVLEMKDARGQALRLFVDQQSHLPLMLAYQEVRPRTMLQGGPGGRRGAGGPGGRGQQGERPSPEEMRRRMESMPPPAPSAVQVSLGEYAAVDGVKLPRHVAVSVDGTPAEEWTLEKIKVNPSIKAGFFDKK